MFVGTPLAFAALRFPPAGGNLNAAKANGVPTNKVKIALFVNTAFCATMFAACQVFEVNTADTAKGNL